MKKYFKQLMSTGFVSVGLVATANAALIPILSGQAVYDDDRNISWIADAALSATHTFGVTGIQANGKMTYFKANDWIAAMNTAMHLGFGDWRLTVAAPGDTTCTLSLAGKSTGQGCAGSEMGHLYHDEFNITSVAEANTPGTSVATGTPSELAKFSNIMSDQYWSGQATTSGGSIAFNFDDGRQINSNKGQNKFVWAVREGGSPIPIPAAVWLFGSGFLAMVGVGRKKIAQS
ncbi:MAG: hypothetical protein V3W04_14600 [Gammaproteobacteria bacterium]